MSRDTDADGNPLKVGSFYWALPVFDPDADGEWENQEQPTLPEDHPFFGLRVRQLVNSAEDTINKKVIAPFRQGLDNMGEDLQNAGETGHTVTGGQLSGPTRALASGVGTLLKNAPVGSNVRDTAMMALTPSLPEGHMFEGLRVIPSAPMAEAEANALRQATGKSLETEEELIAARKQKAEFDANRALAARKVDTDPKASVPSKNKNVSELKTSSVSEQKVDRGTEPSTAMSEEEKADLRKTSSRPLKTEDDYIAARKTQAEWESNKALSAGKVDTDPKANVASKNRNQKTPKDVIESQGLVHKGELVPGSGVHMFEHPDHPGKTAALQEPLTPESVKAKMDSKLGEFGIKPKSVTNNASGQSAASQEAINRVASEKRQGVKRYRVNAGGAKIPLIGVDAVDVQPGPYDHIIQEGPQGTTILSSGAKARPYMGDPKTQAVMSLGRR